jgi:oxygen-independent coproporphyrinogen-3 oxidase
MRREGDDPLGAQQDRYRNDRQLAPGAATPGPRRGRYDDGMPIPLSLYIHIPWCVRKCPYCDFNSHERAGALPVDDYVAALAADLAADAHCAAGRRIDTVFFGGGTPSLFAPDAIGRILEAADRLVPFAADAEVTLETNPGTIEHGRFAAYRAAGINRVSFGVQSFDDTALQRIGRIHGAEEARRAVREAQDAGLDNLNIDLMYALPGQDLDGALRDVAEAVALAPAHVSHYQLTLEPNTLFAAKPPTLPDDDAAWAMQEACQHALAAAGYAQYEVSAYAKDGRRCRHNLAYWSFADYLGIGAGAHGKATRADGAVLRTRKVMLPRSYLERAATGQPFGSIEPVPREQLPFEFMLNALRLLDGFPESDFSARTGLPMDTIRPALDAAFARGWLESREGFIRATALGQRFLNDVIGSFLP